MKTKLITIALLLTTSFNTYSLPSFRFIPSQSMITCRIKVFGLLSLTSQMPISGQLLLNAKQPTHSYVNANINMRELKTAFKHVTLNLKSPLFFDSKRYPYASFKSQRVIKMQHHQGIIQGNLRIKDINRLVTFAIRLSRQYKDPRTKQTIIIFDGNTSISRSAFGMLAYASTVSDQVDISIHATLIQTK